MNILVTGGAGYIGSHVVKELLETDHQVVVYDNLQKGHKEAVLGGVFVEGDLADRELLDRTFSKYDIEAVIHLAADSLVGESMENPAKYYRNNLVNGLNLLDAMVKHNVKKIVFSSTAAVYGDVEEVPITEDLPKDPTSVYGKSKLFFEEIMKDYDQAYGLKFVSLRYFNASGADESGKIGEDHNPESHLIPIVLQKALGLRDKLAIFGTDYPTRDGSCVRDYIHVTDLAQAHILGIEALEAGKESEIYNLGNGDGYSVKEVINVASEVVGKEIEAVEGDRRAGDPATLIASSDRIREDLAWNPQYGDLKTIIETAWKWHMNHPAGFKK
ncbi:UDP-glucose 4-epimerase [Orenia metallireducens]|uniref:UDP-glucose 4-epimerase n=1 Tax=Orenia metallireducens TaxID=1413210 RepID=A0A285H4B5_9FIRM|nr:UDP-glucose 4-epimerase GalE [Orenia metallireducens]PRX28584.1 UDP-glucose 4-epimerase [Orenia metallireducens]SNY30585.1 UDP-glucose 4-epimerase [Orenia metallireducens]